MWKKTAECSLEIGEHLKHRDRKQMCKRLPHAKVAQSAPPTTNSVITWYLNILGGETQ